MLSTTSTHFTDTQTLAGLLLQRAQLCAQLAPGIEHETFGTRSLEFTLFTLALVAAVVRRMLKTRVTLGNVFRVLLNLTRILLDLINICSVQGLLLLLNFHAVNINILSLVHQLQLLLTLTFVPLPYLFGSCHDMYVHIQFNFGTFEDCIVLFNSQDRSFLFQSLYQVIPLLLWQFSKSAWAPFHHKLAQHDSLGIYI